MPGGYTMTVGRYVCTVNQVGPASDGSETPAPVVYINLTDTAGAFEDFWFYAANGIQQQLLDVGIAAIADGKDVAVGAVEPNPGNNPYTQINRIFGFVLPVPPVAPADFQLGSLTSSPEGEVNPFTLAVSWEGDFDSSVSFEINWQSTDGGASGSQSVGANLLSYDKLSLDGGYTYNLYVVAVNSVGKSAPSNTITVSILEGQPIPPQVSTAQLSAAVETLPQNTSNSGLLIKGTNFAANETVAVAVEWTTLSSTGPHVLAPLSTDSSGSFEVWFTGDNPDGLCPILVESGQPQPAQNFFVCASGQISKQTVSASAGPFTCELGVTSMAWHNCHVNQVGPASDATDTPAPVIYINLTDVAGSFTDYWFFIENGIQDQALAVAIAAMNGNKQVAAGMDPPNAGNSPFTGISRLYLQTF